MANKIQSFALFGAAKIALILLMAACVICALVIAGFGFIPTDFDPTTGASTYTVIPGSNISSELKVAELLAVSDLTARFMIAALRTALFLLLAAFFLQALLIVRSVQRANPFTRANATRLARMGWIVLAPALFDASNYIAGLRSPTSENVMMLVILSAFGLVLLILAGVFRRGIAMREDLEGTV